MNKKEILKEMFELTLLKITLRKIHFLKFYLIKLIKKN
jgi:hypothetical protein